MTRNELIEKHIPLVWSIARKRHARFPTQGLDLEDLVSCGMIGLCKAADKFDASLGFKFYTYAYATIVGYVHGAGRSTGIAKAYKEDGKQKLRWSTNYEAVPKHDLPSLNPLQDVAAETMSEYELLLTHMAKLTERQRSIIQQHHQEEKSLREIGNVLGISRERVRQIEEEAIKKLKEFYDADKVVA